MELSSFIKNLLEEGSVTIASRLFEFQEADLKESVIILKNYYEKDILHMPSKAPDFSSAAAVWGAKYLYHATQFVMLRDQAEETVKVRLTDYSGEITPEIIYSADLSLRYLQDVLHFAKGLAPDDILVKCISRAAFQWPFSSVGMELNHEVDDEKILEHPSLKYAYIDRIILKKDRIRAKKEQVSELIQEVLGNYTDTLWPDFSTLKTITS